MTGCELGLQIEVTTTHDASRSGSIGGFEKAKDKKLTQRQDGEELQITGTPGAARYW